MIKKNLDNKKSSEIIIFFWPLLSVVLGTIRFS